MQPADAAAVRAVLFDAYGTLFDVYSVGVAAERRFPGAGERLALLWRDKQIEYTRLSSMSGRPRSFRDCTRAGLRFAARRLELALDAAGEDELMACYDRLDPFRREPRRAARRCATAACAPASSATATPTCSPRWSATPASPTCSTRC